MSLPNPSQDELARSQALEALLTERIRADGPMRFADYMQAALYEPGHGYYVTGKSIFGRGGDFQTAPTIGKLFGECLAEQCLEVLRAIQAVPHTDGHTECSGILEFGAGNGELAAALLPRLYQRCIDEQLPLPAYHVIEPSAALRESQQQCIAAALREHKFESELPAVQWHMKLPVSFTGVVIANEVLDAMPVESCCFRDGAVFLQQVESDGQKLMGDYQPADSTFSAMIASRYSEQLSDLPSDYCFEINSALDGWVAALGSMLVTGAALIVDYGYPRRELFLPERHAGTLMCYYRHHAHSDPFFLPGQQDITAHVDFTSLAEAAATSGLELNGYCTQAAFLQANGLIELASTGAISIEQGANELMITNPDSELAGHLQMMQQVKTLTLPGGMGERFQVMALSCNLDFGLQGFSREDLSHRL